MKALGWSEQQSIDRETRSSRSDRIENHFLGAVVLNQIKVHGRQVDTVEVIDGQQRLTTPPPFLAAFRERREGPGGKAPRRRPRPAHREWRRVANQRSSASRSGRRTPIGTTSKQR
jgi:hypothetical protein